MRKREAFGIGAGAVEDGDRDRRVEQDRIGGAERLELAQGQVAGIVDGQRELDPLALPRRVGT